MIVNKKKRQHVYNELQAKLYSQIGMTGTYKVTFDRLKDILNQINIKGQRWLDFGCGPGRSTKFLSDMGAQAIGVDKSNEMIEAAKEKNPDLMFKLSIDNFNGSLGLFDGALSTFVFFEISSKNEMNKALRYINNLLKPNAPFVLATINPFTVGKRFESWNHSPKKLRLKSGDPIICRIISKSNFEVTDYYWTIKDYKNVLEKNDFIVEKVLMHRNSFIRWFLYQLWRIERVVNQNNGTLSNSFFKTYNENDAWLIILARKTITHKFIKKVNYTAEN